MAKLYNGAAFSCPPLAEFKQFFIYMSDNDKKSHENNDKWWRQGLLMFAESTGWIAIPVIGALFLGNWLDEKYQTKPLYFISLTIMAFIISCIGIGMVGIKYIKQIEKEEKSKKLEKDNPSSHKATKDEESKEEENNVNDHRIGS